MACGDLACGDLERGYSKVGDPNELAIARGGSRLTRRPLLLLSFSCFASIPVCTSKAASGDNVLAISPAKWVTRGDGKPRGEGSVELIGSCDFDRKSINVGRVAIATNIIKMREAIDHERCFPSCNCSEMGRKWRELSDSGLSNAHMKVFREEV